MSSFLACVPWSSSAPRCRTRSPPPRDTRTPNTRRPSYKMETVKQKFDGCLAAIIDRKLVLKFFCNCKLSKYSTKFHCKRSYQLVLLKLFLKYFRQHVTFSFFLSVTVSHKGARWERKLFSRFHKLQILKFLSSFRNRKSANFFGVPVRKS